jgi:hypothetical protein
MDQEHGDALPLEIRERLENYPKEYVITLDPLTFDCDADTGNFLA